MSTPLPPSFTGRSGSDGAPAGEGALSPTGTTGGSAMLASAGLTADSFTWDDLGDVPEDGHRYEIIDGSLVVSPAPGSWHDAVSAELEAVLRAACPTGWRVLGPVGLLLGRTVRMPDKAVVRSAALRPGSGPLSAADVLLAVEVESPGSITTDRVTKPAEYAAAGIQHYWRVDPIALRVTAYALDAGGSREVGSWAGEELVERTEPFAVRFRPAVLAG